MQSRKKGPWHHLRKCKSQISAECIYIKHIIELTRSFFFVRLCCVQKFGMRKCVHTVPNKSISGNLNVNVIIARVGHWRNPNSFQIQMQPTVYSLNIVKLRVFVTALSLLSYSNHAPNHIHGDERASVGSFTVSRGSAFIGSMHSMKANTTTYSHFGLQLYQGWDWVETGWDIQNLYWKKKTKFFRVVIEQQSAQNVLY